MTPTITVRNTDRLQHVAVTRLQLYTAGQVHALIYPFQAWLTKEVSETADGDGIADAGKLAGVLRAADTRWRGVMSDYVALLTRARQQGGSIAFGPLRLRHNYYITAPVERLQEAFTPTLDDWGKLAEMWLRRRNYALQVAQQHVYSDGLNLSQRIWRLEQGSMQTIRNTIATGMAQRTSAVELAQQLEGQLNAGQDWPRWTRARLSKMDARERAQDAKGLLRSASDVPPGGSAGISYNALRLARNEIQIGNHAVTSDIAQNFPGIVGRKVVLSPAHPQSDICDEYAAGGPYEKTANFLPLHPQCVTPGQLVQTRRGPVPIELVWKGDYVLTHRGRYCLVTAAWGVSHSDQVYEFETAEGRFEVTGNHPVLLDRGWVNAEDVQLGDHILYAAGGVLPYLASSVAKDAPTLAGKPGITGGVFGGCALVPSDAIYFNGNLAGDECEVKEVSSNLELPFVDQASGIQSINHGQLCASGVVDSPLPQSQEHRHEAGIIDPLDSGDFATHFRPLGDVASVAEQLPVSLAHLGSGGGAPAAIILKPLVGDRFAVRAQWDTVGDQQFFETPVGDSVTLENVRGSETLNYVDLAQKLSDGQSGFSFDSQGLELCGADVVLGEMGSGPSLHLQAANGASDGHNNLLLLSPDLQWGAGSGNPGVRGVITPSQALLHYTTVLAIQRRHYTGNVYNMTVAGDNSYTVGGHVVHNCLCRWEEVLMPPSDFAKQAGAWARGESDFLDGYTSWLGVRALAPIPDTLTAAGMMELATAMNTWLDGNVDAMATVMQL